MCVQSEHPKPSRGQEIRHIAIPTHTSTCVQGKPVLRPKLLISLPIPKGPVFPLALSCLLGPSGNMLMDSVTPVCPVCTTVLLMVNLLSFWTLRFLWPVGLRLSEDLGDTLHVCYTLWLEEEHLYISQKRPLDFLQTASQGPSPSLCLWHRSHLRTSLKLAMCAAKAFPSTVIKSEFREKTFSYSMAPWGHRWC
jgi:hypothetical protein